MEFIRVRRGFVSVIDQTLLPGRIRWIRLSSLKDIEGAILTMKVRGAPLIGIVGAHGMALAAQRSKASTKGELDRELREVARSLEGIRPTGKNLSWALQRVLYAVEAAEDLASARRAASLAAEEMLRDDVKVNRRIGVAGAALIRDGDTILTHCNTGSLATAGYGTALGVIRTAWEGGKRITVYATETRPLLQGARLTAFELRRLGIPVKLIVDGAVGLLLYEGLISKAFVGADRIMSSGHVLNKIGTYPIAVLAKENGVPFYVAAPTSTIDPEADLKHVAIEQRDQREVLMFEGKPIAPSGVGALNPAFDVTPPRYVSAIVTERGVAFPPLKGSIKRILRGRRG